MADLYGDLINRLALQEAQALAIYDEIIKRYQPGGAFEKSYLQQLGVRKATEVGRESQQLISSGLYGTTTMAGLPGKWEKEVGGPERLRLEDIQMQRLSEAQRGKATFLTPDYGLTAQLASQIGAGGGYYSPDTSLTPTVGKPYKSLEEWMRTEFNPPSTGGTPYAAPSITPTTTPTTTAVPTTPVTTTTPVKVEGYGPMFGTTLPEGYAKTATGVAPTQTGATPAVDIDAEWAKFKAANPYYMKGKTAWMKSRGYYFGPPTPYYEAGGGWQTWK